jgi:hypothetical protein
MLLILLVMIVVSAILIGSVIIAGLPIIAVLLIIALIGLSDIALTAMILFKIGKAIVGNKKEKKKE